MLKCYACMQFLLLFIPTDLCLVREQLWNLFEICSAKAAIIDHLIMVPVIFMDDYMTDLSSFHFAKHK